jgi:UDP-glucose 4-epimerase
VKALVTGGAGFIGSHIVDAMLEEGHSVAVIDDLSTGISGQLDPRARLYRVDVSDTRAVEEVFDEERPDLVNHHAAQVDVRRSMKDPVGNATVNLIGSVNLLNLSAKYGVDRFILASTSAVYSEPAYLPMDESHPIAPQSAYGASKYSAENYVRFFADAHGLRYKIFRYGNVYGPRQNPKGEAGVVAIFAGQLLEGEQSTIFGDGSKTRDYIFVTDIAKANTMAMEPAGDDQVYNLSRGTGVSDLEIFEAVRTATGVQMEPLYAPKRPGEADNVCLDSSRAERLLGWTPTVPLDDGVARAVKYHRSPAQGQV